VVQEEQHLRIPVVGRKRPAMAEDDGLTRTPILVKYLGTVFGGMVLMIFTPLLQ